MPELFSIPQLMQKAGVPGPVAAVLAPVFGRLSGLSYINREYERFHPELDDLKDDPLFFTKALRAINVQFEVESQDYERVPKDGPLLVVANHPYGGVDGIILGALLKAIRPEAKLMGNYLLAQMDGIAGSLITVDPFDEESSVRANIAGMRAALKHLRAGKCLGVFPSGEVSHFRFGSKGAIDPVWSPHVVSLAEKSGASILPIYFKGQNSLTFQLLGLLHPRLRTLLLAREFRRMRGSRVALKIGEAIPPDRIRRFENKAAATDYLRLKTYSLSAVPRKSSHLRFPFRSASALESSLQPLAAAQEAELLQQEVTALPMEQCLVEQGDLEVYYARAGQIPVLLQEIGRLREETFRAVGEGTGQPIDLDRFDEYYVHLFLWNKAEAEIAGAYRIGLADEIVAQHGLKGLYTSSLFQYRSGFMDKIGPSLELGRSFIRLKYQKKQSSLSLIWRGVGEFIAKHPRYRILFGPVSISDAYHSISKNLMVHFFREHSFDDEMSQLVTARKPPKSKSRLRGSSLKNIAESITSIDSVSAIVSGFEDDKKGIPILLRHYLKLNGVLISFNVDPAFQDVIDGLILVDLLKSEPRLLQRYFGKSAYAIIADYHAGKASE
ncbi:MAG: lysophospholipid acyltransferase family protein [Opitutales bacterium]